MAFLWELFRQGRSLSGQERNCCYLNTHGGRFADISGISGLSFDDDGRGVAIVDWDFDGDLDLWLANRTAPQVRYMQNNHASEHHYLAVRLEGVTCARDAIGARAKLYLKGVDAPLIKTVRAGDGFLSQSSKWLHFGLGQAAQIERIVVHWPGGEKEELTGLEPDRRYAIVQATGQAKPWEPPTRPGPLTASKFEGEPPGSPPRVPLTYRVPMPRLEYETFSGSKARVIPVQKEKENTKQQPVLLTLWASWCGPCVEELSDLEKHQDALSAAGLRTVALSVDGVGKDSDVAAAQALAKRLKLTMPLGLASAEVVDTLQVVHDQLLERRLPLGVPSSFLIDAEGQLAVIYRGRLSASQLLDDVKLLPLEGDELRRAALPFAGRWHQLETADVTLHTAKALFDEGFNATAIDYIREHRSRLKTHSQYALLAELAADRLRDAEDYLNAIRWYGEATDVNPRLVNAHYHRALLLDQVYKQPAKAVPHYRTAIRLDSGHALAKQHLAWVLATCADAKVRDPKEALRWARQLPDHDDQDPAFLDTLAVAYAANGQFDRAIETEEEAIRLAQEAGDRQQAVDFQRRLALFRNRQGVIESPPGGN